MSRTCSQLLLYLFTSPGLNALPSPLVPVTPEERRVDPNIVPFPGEFLRGDSNGDLALDISDAIQTLRWLFVGAEEPKCMDSADANDDGVVDLSDAISTLGFLFLGDPQQLPPPFPSFGDDPTEDEFSCL